MASQLLSNVVQRTVIQIHCARTALHNARQSAYNGALATVVAQASALGAIIERLSAAITFTGKNAGAVAR